MYFVIVGTFKVVVVKLFCICNCPCYRALYQVTPDEPATLRIEVINGAEIQQVQPAPQEVEVRCSL
jgi:hypothetical protein